MKVNYWQSFEEGCFYHIYNRAVGDIRIFHEDAACREFLTKYKKYLHPYFELMAYCLMPNHFHFIVKVKSLKEIKDSAMTEETNIAKAFIEESASLNQLIGDQFRRIFSSIAIKYNNKYKRRGPLFSPRTKRISIDSGQRLKYLISYVHHNPIHHKYDNKYSNWKYSSFNALRSSQETLLEREKVIELFGSRESFDLYHQDFKWQKSDENID